MARKRRAARPQPDDQAPVVEVPADPYAGFADKEWSFAFLPEVEPDEVDEKALHALVKEWRHGRATRTLGEVLSDAYIAVFAVVLIGAMVVNVVIGSQTASAACESAACLNGRTLVPWGVFFALGALSLSIARLFGPVLASAAEGFWMLEAPIGRARLLRGRLWAVIVAAAGVGAVVAAGTAAVAGEPWVTVGAWALASGLVSGGLVAWAAREQSFERVRALRVAQGLFGGLAALTLAAIIAVAAGWVHVDAPGWLGLAPWALALLGGVLVIVCGLGAHRRLERFGRSRLTSGGSLVSGLQGAMFGLDLGLARDILVDREAIARGHVRPTPGRGSGATALVWRDLHRLARTPRPLLGLLGAIGAPYACDAVGLSLLTPLLSALALMVALIPMLGSLRVLSRTKGLARTMPFSTAGLRTATAAVPALLALVWALATLPAFAGITGGVPRDPATAALTALACGLAGLAAAIRWQTAKPVDFAVPMMATGAGAVPPTLVFNLLRGIDVAALVTAPLLLNQSPMWSLGLALLVLSVLRTGFNMEEMSENAKDQQRLLEQERARR